MRWLDRTVRIGDRGVTATILKPGGILLVDGTRHPARCLRGFIDVSVSVIVIGGDNLGLIVQEIDAVVEAVELRDHGQVVYSSFGDRTSNTGQAADESRRKLRQNAIRRAFIGGAAIGCVTSLAAFWHLRSLTPAPWGISSWLALVCLVSGGSVWGSIAGRCIFGAFEQIENLPNQRLAVCGTILAMAGSSAALAIVWPQRGIWVGLATALSTTVILGALLPALGVAGEWISGDSLESNATADIAAANEVSDQSTP